MGLGRGWRTQVDPAQEPFVFGRARKRHERPVRRRWPRSSRWPRSRGPEPRGRWRSPCKRRMPLVPTPGRWRRRRVRRSRPRRPARRRPSAASWSRRRQAGPIRVARGGRRPGPRRSGLELGHAPPRSATAAGFRDPARWWPPRGCPLGRRRRVLCRCGRVRPEGHATARPSPRRQVARSSPRDGGRDVGGEGHSPERRRHPGAIRRPAAQPPLCSSLVEAKVAVTVICCWPRHKPIFTL